ncbi:MAG: hypothetical protein H0W88_05655 [Parachlamydiaceae bacterium]|nr:hypothetical protein [Parachlamydiaceae bacterium]
MKLIALILTFVIQLSSVHSLEGSKPVPFPTEVKFTERRYPFHTHYKLESPEGHLGEIIREKMDVKSHFSFYGHRDDHELIAIASVRFFTLGQLFKWSNIIDIYSPSNELLGKIKGCFLTTSPAKFEFYNNSEELLGIALMDEDSRGFNLLSPIDNFIIARYTRIINEDGSEYWLLNIYQPDIIPSSFYSLFGAFIFDKEEDRPGTTAEN